MIALNPRKFKSFNAAADEAAWSRMYGGIHYEAAILDGVKIGNCLAENLLKKVKLGSGERTCDSSEVRSINQENRHSNEEPHKKHSRLNDFDPAIFRFQPGYL
jgi:hypothetical protein